MTHEIASTLYLGGRQGARPPGLAALWVAAKRAGSPAVAAHERRSKQVIGHQLESKREIILADKY